MEVTISDNEIKPSQEKKILRHSLSTSVNEIILSPSSRVTKFITGKQTRKISRLYDNRVDQVTERILLIRTVGTWLIGGFKKMEVTKLMKRKEGETR